MADLGATLRVSEVAQNVWGTSAAATSAPSAVVGSGTPINVGAPVVSGSTIVGHALTANPGSWTQSPAVSVQWLRCNPVGEGCTPMPGAISRSYLLGSGDTGASFRVQETASNRFGSAAAMSAPTGSVCEPGLVASLMHISARGATLSVTIACTGPSGNCRNLIKVTGRVLMCGKSIVTSKAHCHPKPRSMPVGVGSVTVQVGQTTTAQIRLNARGRQAMTEAYRLAARVDISGITAVHRNVVFFYARIRSFFTWTWAFGPAHTSVSQLLINRLPAKARVDITCRGTGCPFGHRRLSPPTRSLRLTTLFAHSRLTPGTRIVITVSAANQVAEVVVFTIRRGAAPTATTLCQPPGAMHPTACV